MMSTTKEAWEQVGETWRDLGSHLRDDYRKLGEDQAREAREDEDKLHEAARQLTDHVGQALGSMREMVKEPETKQSMERVIGAMSAAISATFNDAAGEFRRRLPPKGKEESRPEPVGGVTGVANTTGGPPES